MNQIIQETKTQTTISSGISDDDEWEYVSTDSIPDINNEEDEDEEENRKGNKLFEKKNMNTSTSIQTKTFCNEEKIEDLDILEKQQCSLMHRCESTPVFSTSFSNLEDDLSYVLDCDSSVDAHSIMTTSSTTNDDTVLLTHKKSNMKKVPSFKDILASNMQQIEEERRVQQLKQKELEEKRREDFLQRRKNMKTRIIVSPIKRCVHSTGDLRSLVIHEEEEEGYSGGGGGVIHEEEDEVLGDTDAQEYYNRKSHGSKGRANGLKIRPDEAKRKDIIMHKKNAQRRAQGLSAK